MITKNFKKIAAALMCVKGTSIYCFIPVVDQTGTQRYASLPNASNTQGRFFPSRGYYNQFSFTLTPGIVAGSGVTPPTEDDYNIETPISLNYTSVPVEALSLDNNGNPLVTLTIQATNNSNTTITISELGYFVGVGCNDTSGAASSTVRSILIDRTVLDTPVTIPADGSATITYTLKGIWNEGA